MPTSQPFLAPGVVHEYHLEYELRDGIPRSELIDRLGVLWGPLITGMTDPGLDGVQQMPGGATRIVVGFGPGLWAELAPGQAPASLEPMRQIDGPDGHVAPATQHDLWVWLLGGRQDVLFDAARAVNATLADSATLVAEQACFPYHNSLSTMGGFIDGTANPSPFQQARWAVIPDGEPGEGGSTVMLQRWVFDGFDEFNALPPAEQEHAFGRRKPFGEELDPQPDDSHVARTTLKRGGEEFKIVRRNAYWGTPAETGVMFVGFAADPTVTFEMLERMYGHGDPPVADRLIAFSTATSGSFYFVPSIEALSAVGVTPPEPD